MTNINCSPCTQLDDDQMNITAVAYILARVYNKRREESTQLSQYPVQMHCVKFVP